MAAKKLRHKFAAMSTSQTVRITARQVRPILSIDREDARRRVLNLYKAWYRQLPYIVRRFDIPKTVPQCKEKLREQFRMHDDLKDIRVIDMLVVKGQIDLQEVVNVWKQKGHIMQFWKDSVESKPTDFMSKFLSGHQ